VTAYISVPYSNAWREVGMGRGPAAILDELGEESTVVEVPDTLVPEIARTFELSRGVASAGARAVAAGEMPLVLAGACNACWGTTAAAGGEPLSVLWLDAHADFDLPDDNVSGFFDVMALSTLTGGCWHALAASIPGFRAVAERNVLLAGVRDLEDYQRERLERSDLQVVPGDRPRLAELTLEKLDGLAGPLYLHVDLDSLDPAAVGPANEYAAAGGFTLDEVLALVTAAQERFDIACASITAYDPEVDPEGVVRRAGARIARAIAASG
jgi:arginase